MTENFYNTHFLDKNKFIHKNKKQQGKKKNYIFIRQ